ncbi:MAG TPA: hypothetical protein VMW72_03575 [Sedimentisphaerales bacterium]|nr:hypothetical protein [Sedimentisphaerales bacterium]
MKQQTFFKAVLYCSLMVLIMLSAQVRAQSSQSRGRGLYGDWQVKVDYDGRQFESILSFSRDSEGNQTGSWISFMGLSELKDIKYEEGQLSFTWSRQNREGESTTSSFKGTVEEGKISGTLSSDRGEFKLQGKRIPRVSRAVGSWAMKYNIGDREVTSTLVIKADKEGNLTAQWEGRRSKSEITDLQYERGNLTFKRKSTYQDTQRESTFEGTVQGDTLSGVMKSERGEMTVEGKLIGGSLIGTWNLEVTSEQGTRKQRLSVNPDMSGLYGAIPIKKINLEDGKVDFLAVLEFGDQSFEIRFEGKLDDSKITGELTTSRGSQKIKGTKVIRTFRRRSTG